MNKIRIPAIKSVCLTILFSSLFLSSCDKLEVDNKGELLDNPIKIGLMMPILYERSVAENRILALNLAVEEINNAGGVIGRPIQIVIKDDEGNGDVGIIKANQFKEEGIQHIIGPGWSGVTLKIAPEVTIPNNMLVMSYSATNPKITDLDDNSLIWRTCPSDVIQGKIAANYIKRMLNKQTVGIIHSTDAWASGLAEAFKNSFVEKGGTVVNMVNYPGDADFSVYDFRSSLDILFQDNPEVIYIAAFSSDGSKLTNDIGKGNYMSEGYHPLFFSNDGIYTNDFLRNGNKTVLNGMLGTVPASSDNDINFSAFKANYKKRYGLVLESYSEHIYDALYTVCYAMEKAKSTDPNIVKEYLQSVSGGIMEQDALVINVNEFIKGKEAIANGKNINYQGASGALDLDVNGDPTSGTYKLWKVENNSYIVHEYISFP